MKPRLSTIITIIFAVVAMANAHQPVSILVAGPQVATIAATAQAQKPSDIDSLIRALDRTIGQRDTYRKQKEARMASLRSQVLKAPTDSMRFYLLADMLEEYRASNTDSALSICLQREEIDNSIGSPSMQLQATLSTANILSALGLYIESLNLMRGISSSEVPQSLKQSYYHAYCNIFGLLSDYSLRAEDKARYLATTNAYRDTLISCHKPGTINYAVLKCDQFNATGHPQQGVELLTAYLDTLQSNPRTLGYAAYTLSESYRLLGDTDNQMRQLVISAIGDMQSATKEYISLRKLAMLLYDQGDIEHAYQYLRLCMQDAVDCNARLRMIEANEIFNVVNKAYLETIDQHQSRMRWALILVCILAALLAGALYWLFREMKTLARARREVAQANEQLQTLNQQLLLSNQALEESANLKQEYITQYMDQCSVYIDKLDHCRKTLTKIVNSGSIDELKKYTRTLGRVDAEIQIFYQRFDETFLKLFPTFVEDFNALLRPDEQLQPKAPGQLSTELRIFALIRLGITDSAKIAQFLRYTLTTIYNYRTRVRNRALGDRDRLEDEIMKIGTSHQ